MRKSFVTLFPHTYNINLLKDVGCIPYVMHKDFGYESTVVSFNNDNYVYLKEHVRGLKMHFIHSGNERIACIKYVIHNAKKIDVLNMYHLSIGKSLLCLGLYKILNKRGIGYLKLDLDFKTLNIIEKYSTIKKHLIRHMIKKVDIVSAESTVIAERLEKIINRKIEYIPNGVLENSGYSSLDDLNSQKRNVFLSVGRLGTEQKATENIVEAYIKIKEESNWNLFLVGKCEEKFAHYLDELFEQLPDLKDRIIVTGEILDKKRLSDIYRMSNILVLPSKYESFALVNVEAILNGCSLLLSDQVAPATDFKKLGDFCEIVEYGNINQLADEMLTMSKKTYDANIISKIATDNFLWSNICGKLNELIMKKQKRQSI